MLGRPHCGCHRPRLDRFIRWDGGSEGGARDWGGVCLAACRPESCLLGFVNSGRLVRCSLISTDARYCFWGGGLWRAGVAID